MTEGKKIQSKPLQRAQSRGKGKADRSFEQRASKRHFASRPRSVEKRFWRQ